LESFEKSKEKLAPRIQMCKQSLSRKREVPRYGRRTHKHWHGRVETLPGWRRSSDKLTALFEPCHAGQFPSHFRGITKLDDARGKKQIWRLCGRTGAPMVKVWCPLVWTWALSKANLLYWRKYL